MGSLFQSRTRTSFELPLASAFIVGSLITLAFYCLLIFGLVDSALLKRYCLSHFAAQAGVGLFFIMLSGLVIKLNSVAAQRRLATRVIYSVEKFVEEGHEVARSQRSLWLEARWLTLPSNLHESWIGKRIAEIIERQIRRGRHALLENDIRDLARDDARIQDDSHKLLRMIGWTLPVLGLLGALMLASSSARHALAEQQEIGQATQQANQSAVTATLQSSRLVQACDALTLTIALAGLAFFVQHAVRRIELDLLATMDEAVRDNLVEFLGSDAHHAEHELLSPVRQMSDDLIAAVHQLVEQQVNLWSRAMGETQKQWATWSAASSDELRVALCESLDKSLTQHADQIEKIQQEAGRQVDARWQQWQITLSDQARVMHAQQKELVRQTESIDRLITSAADLQKVEDVIRESFGSFEMIEQLRQATFSVGEAVAVLATSLERAGIIRGVPVKPRSARKADDKADVKADDDENDAARKAA